jgi:dienelactone hydrolase
MSTGTCPDYFSGTISTGTPTGIISTIHDLPTYVTTPEDGVKPKGLVVFVTDSFGYTLPNSQVLADQYAKKGGFIVYVPDLMGGKPQALTLSFLPIRDSKLTLLPPGNAMDSSGMHIMEKLLKPASWFTTLFVKPILIIRVMIIAIPFFIKNRLAVTKPRVFTFFQALRSSPPPFPTNSLKIGVAGFCFGGKYAVLLAQDTPSSRAPAYNPSTQSADGPLTPLIDCAFTAHPSMLNIPADIDAVTRPLSVAVGNEDMALKSASIVKMRDILEKKGDDHQCVILAGARHGFSVRMDPKDEVQMGHAATAEKQAIDWFTKWFT